ncbi:hypothetical protein [Bosea sp. (in: a-proteobacteria)]|uniref:hypothetical protein n=1 Tax=Bosea sp. (in: a-proteobacteria) TaxID=1871050 RepID=UPI002734AD98|nr:hypothetical protein [Bosea sp. (in: a-proteobacteria)]MDP3408007.1 hypothetical protein [Bosea sp. (in: a-proteobacteria)]
MKIKLLHEIDIVRQLGFDLNKLFYKHSASGITIREYSISIVNRLLELSEDCIESLERGRMITASMTARGLLETAGTFIDFIDKMIRARNANDKEKFRNTLRKHFFASREFETELGIKSPHVADGIRFLDKHMPEASDIYNVLCEAVHPNWAGTGGLIMHNSRDSPIFMRSYFAICRSYDSLAATDKVSRSSFIGPLRPDMLLGW